MKQNDDVGLAISRYHGANEQHNEQVWRASIHHSNHSMAMELDNWLVEADPWNP